MQKKSLGTFILICTILIIGMSSYAEAAPAPGGVEAFYKGKTIKFVTPTAPGGVFDMLARQTAPALQKYSGASVVVENMPGGGGLVGGGYLFNVAKPDGLTIGIFNTSGMALYEALELATVKYKLDQFTYVARTDVLNQMVFTSKASGFKTVADMQKATKTIRVGTTSPSSASAVAGALLIEAFGLNAKMVSGYKGSREIMLALVGGKEIDAYVSTPAGFDDYLANDQVTVVAAWHDKRRPSFPNTPSVLETPGLKPEGRKFIELGKSFGDIGRMIIAPPGVSEARRSFLEKALLAKMREPAMAEWAKSIECNLSPLPGKESKNLVLKIMTDIPMKERPNIKNIITKKYYF